MNFVCLYYMYFISPIRTINSRWLFLVLLLSFNIALAQDTKLAYGQHNVQPKERNIRSWRN